MALKNGNAACVLGTVRDRDAFEKIYYIKLFFLKKTLYNCSFEKIPTGRLR